MEKSSAIKLINHSCNLKLTTKNSCFSNVNATANVWWLEPKIDKFAFDYYLILNNSQIKKLYLIKINGNTINLTQTKFRIRTEKNALHIEIPVNDKNFMDRFSNFSFNQYVIEKLEY